MRGGSEVTNRHIRLFTIVNTGPFGCGLLPLLEAVEKFLARAAAAHDAVVVREIDTLLRGAVLDLIDAEPLPAVVVLEQVEQPDAATVFQLVWSRT